MKFRFKKRIVSAVLSAALLIGAAGPVLAGGDTMPPREGEQGYLGENQPTYHGHRAYDVLNWSPETDEYASFMRAEVPLQDRNEAFAATQANPLLDQAVQSLSLTEDYGNEFFNPTQYNDNFAQYVFNFWQYQDIRASWHGVVTNPTPDSLFDPEAGWWERAYEFGVLNIPNPAYTNAAHKNGVLSIGCIFFPRTEHTDEWVFQDENGRFPMADKLVEIANYYGFDGYFINAEEQLPASFMPLYEEFCRAMTSQGLYIQVYASNLYGQNNQGSWGRIDYYNKTAEQFSNWIKEPGEETIAANSLYMNPDPSKAMVESSVATMEALGLSAKDTVFMTLEAGQTGFSGTRGTLYNTYDENLVPQTGIANLGAGTVWAHLDEQLFGHSGNNSYSENRRGDADYQKYVIARERNWWAGSLDAPTYSGGKGTLDSASLTHEELLDAVLNATFDPVAVANNPDRATPNSGSSQSWRGMSAFISERSVINGSNFYTSFNTGHGMQYFVDGKVSNESEWSNINIQDILPTWQWWIDTESENRLTLDFDYGPEYNAGYDYIQVGGYEGSSSLAIFGDVDAQSDIRLYKTELSVNENTVLNLTYNKPSKTDNSELSLVLYLKDGEDGVKTVYVPVENANRKTSGWVKTTLDLSAYAGETVVALGFSVNTYAGAIPGYQINLGELCFTDGSLAAPAAPTGLTIDRMFDTGEVYLSWDLADYSQVQKYNVYAVYEDGSKTYVGGAYADYYYIKDTMYNVADAVAFQVTAEGADGKESAPATAYCNTNAANLAVEEAAGALNATWTNPDVDYTSILAEVTLPDNYYGNTNVYTATFAKGETSGTVAIPVVDGSRYILRLSFLDAEGNVLTFQDCSGELPDLYCESYSGGLEARTMASGWKLINPEVYDWWHMWLWDSKGKPIALSSKTMLTRGVDSLINLPVKGDFGYIEVQLEDFAGNLSEKTRVYWGTETKAVDETVFPDAALLAAVKEQVGTTMADVIAFTGTLNLANTEVKDLTGIGCLENMEALNLSNTAVTEVIGLTNLKEIDISGCSALAVLDFSNSALEKITCNDVTALQALVSVNLEGARLDLSDGTQENAFVAAAAKITEGKNDIVIVNSEISNFATRGTALTGGGSLFNGDETDYLMMNVGNEFIIDLGSAKTVEEWSLVNYASYIKSSALVLYASDDNETYTQIATADALNEATISGKLEPAVTARYFKISVTSRGYGREFKLMGYDVTTYLAGVASANQRPAAYLNVPEKVAYKPGEGVAELSAIPSFTTVRGNSFDSLKGADFIAADYDLDGQMGAGFDIIYVDGTVASQVALDVPATYQVSFVKFGEETTTYNTVVTVAHDETKAALEELVKTAEAIDRAEYTEEQLKAIDDALKNAKEVLAKDNATTQELQEAYDLLREALNHKWGQWTVVTEPTCEEDGLKTRTCQCGEETQEEIIPALGHDYDAVVTEPTCLAGGYTTHTCSNCGSVYIDEYTEALGHDYVAVVTEPTCDTMGYTTHTCSRCGDSYIDSYVQATEHTFVQEVTKEPTCVEEGLMTFTCSDCGKTYTQAIPMVAHTYEETVTAPTCTWMGYTTHTCTVCGHNYITDPVQPTGHSYVLTGVKEAGCGVDGYTGDVVCEICGDVKSTGEVIPAFCLSEAFEDLDTNRWYHKGVDFVLESGLMVGMDETHFAPEGTLTRGQLVTILYRLAGSPEIENETPFTDVAANRFYAKAVAWAYENEIVMGVTGTTFEPNASATREQLVTFLARFAKLQGEDVTAEGDLSKFVDSDSVSRYAVAPMTWAVENGILVGDEAGRLNPRGYATRAQIATIVMRYCQTIGE